jgi:ribulose 1,5-bisphosphate synthetase/thiazole synthase
MEYIIEPERKTPIVAETDLLVCGGGIAGVAAAVCAARMGARVMLLEKYGFLGGLVTGALVITTPPLNNGINLEIAKRLKDRGVYVPCRDSGAEVESLQMHAIDPEVVKYELMHMLQEGKVEFRFHTYIGGTILEGQKIKGVVTESKAGRQAILARFVVDATGDADIAFLAGVPYRLVKKPMTMMFNMVGVDTKRTLAHIGGNWGRLRKVVREALERKEINFELGMEMDFGAPGVHAENLVYEGEINVWSGNLKGLDGTDPADLTRAEVITREHAMNLSSFLIQKVPGFEKARIEYTSTQVGVRATRQIVGQATPSADSVHDINRKDAVAKPYAHSAMRIPFGAIVPQRLQNLLVAGRCLSAEDEILGQLRLIPVCTATGQAAGVAAALALQQGKVPADLNILQIQNALKSQGMELDS